jgi:hypothetical protein
MTSETSLFGEVLTAELAKRGHSVEDLVAAMSEDDRRAVAAHAIRAAMQPTRHPFSPRLRRHTRNERILWSIVRALDITDDAEAQWPLFFAFLAEQEYIKEKSVCRAHVGRIVNDPNQDTRREVDIVLQHRVYGTDPDIESCYLCKQEFRVGSVYIQPIDGGG